MQVPPLQPSLVSSVSPGRASCCQSLSVYIQVFSFSSYLALTTWTSYSSMPWGFCFLVFLPSGNLRGRCILMSDFSNYAIIALYVYFREGCRFLPIRICSAIRFADNWWWGIRLSGIILRDVSKSVPPTMYLEKLTKACGFGSVIMDLESLAIESSRRAVRPWDWRRRVPLVIRPASHVCFIMRLCVW